MKSGLLIVLLISVCCSSFGSKSLAVDTTEGVIKLTKTGGTQTIYVTKAASADDLNVKVLVVDSADHVRVYAATVDVADQPITVTMGAMALDRTGYCRDSIIPTADGKEITTKDSFIKQSVLCKTDDIISTTAVCGDTIEPVLKGKTITLVYATGDTKTIESVKFGDADGGCTGELLTSDVEKDKTNINNILGEYKTVCDANSIAKKRVPRGSYIKATKNDNSETIYISDKNYIVVTKTGATLIYPVTGVEYLTEGTTYTVGSIDVKNSGTCTDGSKWTACTDTTTAPCTATAVAAITIKLDTDTYSGIDGYTITASNELEFKKLLNHNSCILKNIKLSKENNPTIYITTPDGSNKVNVMVVSEDHVRVYDATSELANDKVQTITVSAMVVEKSGYCRDSDIPTVTGKEIPTTESFIKQSVLCPTSGGNIGDTTVCTDTITPALKGKTIVIAYTSTTDSTTTSIAVDGDTAYTLSDATSDATITTILTDYSSICDANSKAKKRVPRGSYIKATKTGGGDTIYISDKNYVKTTTTGVTLVYSITKVEYSEGTTYTIGAINTAKSGTCTDGNWAACKDAATAPCTNTAVAAITITLDGTTYSGIADYTIASSNKADFDVALGHTDCAKAITLKTLKLTQSNKADIYVTKPEGSNSAVKVIVVDSVDHVRVYDATSSLTDSVQTITVGAMEKEKSGYCKDSDIPTAANKEITTTDAFITQSVLCKTSDVISTDDVCNDVNKPASIVITHDTTITAKVDTDTGYAAAEPEKSDTTITEVTGNYGTVCDTNSQTKKRVPRGSYLKATKTGGDDKIYISDKNYIVVTAAGTLIYPITGVEYSEGTKYTIGDIDAEKSGKCDSSNGKWIPCGSATTAPCTNTPVTAITITLTGTTYFGIANYKIESTDKTIFDGVLNHDECKKQEQPTTAVPKGTIMTYTIGDITVYISDEIAVKEKGNEFLVYDVAKTPEPSTGTATGSKYEFTYQATLSGECKDNELSPCKAEPEEASLFPPIIIKYIGGNTPSAKFDSTTAVTILSEKTEEKASDVQSKLNKYKKGKYCESDEIVFEGNSLPNELVMKHTVNNDDSEYYIYDNNRIFYRKNQKQISIVSTKENKSNYTTYTSEKVLDRKGCGFISDSEGEVGELAEYNCVGIKADSFYSIEWLDSNCDFDEENVTVVFNTSKLEIETTLIANGTIEDSKVYTYDSTANKIVEEYGMLIKKDGSGIMYEDISMRVEIPYLLLILIISILLF